MAQQKGDAIFKRFPYVDFIFGPNNIDNLQKWIDDGSQFTDHSSQITALQDNPEYYQKTLPLKRGGEVRAWVSIMHGCDNFCAYCVVPHTRGRERSRPGSDICNEVQTLASQGYKEITLLGQNVNSYGKNLSEKRDFPDLLKVIHEIPGIQRIRFITSHPRDLSGKLIEAMRDLPKLCEHIHLPLQTGSDRILSSMNRGYTYKQYKENIGRLRRKIPGLAITTDIIVGFPGETEEDYHCTLNALREIEFDGIFAFKYSKRPETKALDLPDHVDEKTKSRRLAKVLHTQEDITYKKNKGLEKEILKVLVECPSETDRAKLTGRTKTNKIVNFYGELSDIGSIVNIKILEAKQHSLFGEKV
jgi:tRNA-2-methylthio-N6-dimethylallyladenosine synthase